MKILLANPDDLILRGCVAEPGSFDGRDYISYRLMLQGSRDMGSLNCTKEVYEMAKSIPFDSKVNIIGDYDSSKKNFRISAIQAVK